MSTGGRGRKRLLARRLSRWDTHVYVSGHLTGNLTVESDYFVVGTLLLEHITGSDPFAGPDFASVLKAITKPDASHLVAAIPQLEPQLRETLLSLLAPTPSARRAGWGLLHIMTRRYTPFDPSAALLEAQVNGHPSVFDIALFARQADRKAPGLGARETRRGRLARRIGDSGRRLDLSQGRGRAGELQICHSLAVSTCRRVQLGRQGMARCIL